MKDLFDGLCRYYDKSLIVRRLPFPRNIRLLITLYRIHCSDRRTESFHGKWEGESQPSLTLPLKGGLQHLLGPGDVPEAVPRVEAARAVVKVDRWVSQSRKWKALEGGFHIWRPRNIGIVCPQNLYCLFANLGYDPSSVDEFFAYCTLWHTFCPPARRGVVNVTFDLVTQI